jgi:hypothetical protein
MKIFLELLLSSVLLVALPPEPAPAPFAVVELFTSEGCSSCPSANAVLEKIDRDYAGQNVFVLGFHVDYWNRLGWKDEFSSAAYSARQRQYARQLRLTTIYTPQAVVNGESELVGSKEGGLRQKLTQALARRPDVGVAASIKPGTAGRWTVVSQVTNAPAHAVLNVALVQKRAETRVQRGENGGRTLRHVNVVRQFVTQPAAEPRPVTLTLPDGVSASNAAVLVYVQDAGTGRIEAANWVTR